MVAKNSKELRLLFLERRHDAALQELERCQTQHTAQNLKRNLLDASHIQLGWYESILQMSIRSFDSTAHAVEIGLRFFHGIYLPGTPPIPIDDRTASTLLDILANGVRIIGCIHEQIAPAKQCFGDPLHRNRYL